MGFLNGLGSLAGGVAQGANPYIQQYLQQMQQKNEDTALGQGLYAAYGVPVPSASPSGGMGSIAPPQIPQAAPQATGSAAPPQIPQAAPQATGMARSPMSPAQPMVAQPAPAGLPSQQQQQQQPPQATPPPPQQSQQPTGTAALAANQQQPQQAQPQQRPQQDVSRFAGRFTPSDLIPHMIRSPGMTPLKLGMIVKSPGFLGMLNAEGLAQYRAAQGQIAQERVDVAGGNLAERTRKDQANEALRGWATGNKARMEGYAPAMRAIFQDASQRVNTIQNDNSLSADDKQDKIKAIEADRDKKIEEANKKYITEPPQDTSEGESSGGKPSDYIKMNGKILHYKGTGDRKDEKNWEPVE